MKRDLFLGAMVCFLTFGCESLRFAPSEKQKEHAWLHNRTATIAAQTAKAEKTSNKLQALTDMSEKQSRTFLSYYGFPKKLPQADSANDVLSHQSAQLTQQTLQDSAKRPDAWQVTDNVLEVAIGIAGLLGGVYGAKGVWLLRQAKTKSKALREIIEGNEIFKSRNAKQIQSFKEAHRGQSPDTQQIVTRFKEQVKPQNAMAPAVQS